MKGIVESYPKNDSRSKQYSLRPDKSYLVLKVSEKTDNTTFNLTDQLADFRAVFLRMS